MSNTFTLDNLKSATKRKLGPTTFILGEDSKVELPSIFRLGKEARESIVKAMEDLDKLSDIGETDDDATAVALLVDSISGILRLVAPGEADVLINACADDDPMVTATILSDILAKWMEHTQAGEA